jgi:hypothetical protein
MKRTMHPILSERPRSCFIRCTEIRQNHPLAQTFGRGIIGRGMGRKPFRFIPLANIPLPISPLLSFCLTSSLWLRQPRCDLCALCAMPFCAGGNCEGGHSNPRKSLISMIILVNSAFSLPIFSAFGASAHKTASFWRLSSGAAHSMRKSLISMIISDSSTLSSSDSTEETCSNLHQIAVKKRNHPSPISDFLTTRRTNCPDFEL